MKGALVLPRFFMLLLLLWESGCKCRREQADSNAFVLSHQFIPDPPRLGPLDIEFTLESTTGITSPIVNVQVEGNMSHPGMAPSPAVVQDLGQGRYRARLDITMVGDWFLNVDFTAADGRAYNRLLSFRVEP